MAPTLDSIQAPPLNSAGLVDLICVRSGATILLSGDKLVYNAAGGHHREEKGRSIKFRNSRASCTLEDFELLARHPAFTGHGEPKIVYLAEEHAVIVDDGRVRVTDGALGASSKEMVKPPTPGWNTMSYTEMRRAVKDGRVVDHAEALIYERRNRNREGAIRLLALALAGQELPHPNALKAVDRTVASRRGAAAAAEEPEVIEEPEVPEEPELPGTEKPDDDLAAEIRAAIAAAEGEAEIAEDAAEPIPPEGVQ